jgi:hypothetical protein
MPLWPPQKWSNDDRPFFGTARSETYARAFECHFKCVHRLSRARVRSVGRSNELLSANASTEIGQASAATTASFVTRTVTYNWKYLYNALQPVCKGVANVGTLRRQSCHHWWKLTRITRTNTVTPSEQAKRKKTDWKRVLSSYALSTAS